MEFSHKSVLYDETLTSLNITKGKTYVDCTCGGAGHSKGIISAFEQDGRLVAIDQDPEAIEVITERIGHYSCVDIVHRNFSELKQILGELGISKVHGILADLGVSSHQFDTAERGFSYNYDAPLDMRMSKQGLSAADIVNTYSEQEIARILREYGEEKFASRIARRIVQQREIAPILTTFELSDLVKQAIPAATRRTGGHPAKRSFQALRCATNSEIEKLTDVLSDMFDCLEVGGRISIITFHSIEDRIVKKAFAEYCKGCECPPQTPVCICGKTPAGRLPFKKITPSVQEVEENPRSRSATLRCIEKIKDV